MKFLHHLIHGRLQGLYAPRDHGPTTKKGDDLQSCYADYASAVAKANAMLQRHGIHSAQFAEADIAGMRLFHRVKKLQGLGKPRQDTN